MSKYVDSFKVQNILVKHSVEDCEDFPHKYEFTVDRCSIFYEKTLYSRTLLTEGTVSEHMDKIQARGVNQ